MNNVYKYEGKVGLQKTLYLSINMGLRLRLSQLISLYLLSQDLNNSLYQT